MLYPVKVRPGCLFTKGWSKVSYGETFVDYMDGEPPENQAEVRATISECFVKHII